MTAPATDVTARLDLVRVVRRAIAVIGWNLPAFGVLSLLLAGLPLTLPSLAIQGLAAAGLLSNIKPVAFAEGAALAWVITALPGSVFAAFVFLTIGDDWTGRTASPGERLAAVPRVLLPVLAVQLMNLVGVAIGLVLLVIPGVMLAAVWAVAGPSPQWNRWVPSHRCSAAWS